MKIALFCSSRNIIPSIKTGGTEQPIFYLAKNLAKRGHEVVLFAAKGTRVLGVETRAISPFQTCVEQKYLNIQERITSFYDLNALSKYFKNEADDYDVIQFNSHIFYEILPFTRFSKTPVVIRINYPHNLIYPYIKKELNSFENVHYLPISEFIKSSMPDLDYLDPIHPSVDMNDFKFSKNTGTYLLFMGRVCYNKGVHIAIEVAKKLKMKLVIAGKIDQEDGGSYYDKEIKPYLNSKIEYIGEVGFEEKIKLYQGALATLFPTQWDEPFGNVQIESMACGTPVISFDRASAGEAVKNGVSGFIVENDVESMVEAVNKINSLDRLMVRNFVKEKFSTTNVGAKYEKLYKNLIK